MKNILIALLLSVAALDYAAAEETPWVSCAEVLPGLVSISTKYTTDVVCLARIVAIKSAGFEGPAYWGKVSRGFVPNNIRTSRLGQGPESYEDVPGVSVIYLSVGDLTAAPASAKEPFLTLNIPATPQQITDALAVLKSHSKTAG
jgi:hypothetical protein